MRTVSKTLSKQVSKMDVEIGKMHRELAKLYEQRAHLMQKTVSEPKNTKFFGSTTDIDFPADIIDELVKEEKQEKPHKKARK